MVAARRILFQAVAGQSAFPQSVPGPDEGASRKRLYGRKLLPHHRPDGGTPQRGSPDPRRGNQGRPGQSLATIAAQSAVPARPPDQTPEVFARSGRNQIRGKIRAIGIELSFRREPDPALSLLATIGAYFGRGGSRSLTGREARTRPSPN